MRACVRVCAWAVVVEEWVARHERGWRVVHMARIVVVGVGGGGAMRVARAVPVKGCVRYAHARYTTSVRVSVPLDGRSIHTYTDIRVYIYIRAHRCIGRRLVPHPLHARRCVNCATVPVIIARRVASCAWRSRTRLPQCLPLRACAYVCARDAHADAMTPVATRKRSGDGNRRSALARCMACFPASTASADGHQARRDRGGDCDGATVAEARRHRRKPPRLSSSCADAERGERGAPKIAAASTAAAHQAVSCAAEARVPVARSASASNVAATANAGVPGEEDGGGEEHALPNASAASGEPSPPPHRQDDDDHDHEQQQRRRATPPLVHGAPRAKMLTIAEVAYDLWQQRCRNDNEAERNWNDAVELLARRQAAARMHREARAGDGDGGGTEEDVEEAGMAAARAEVMARGGICV